MSLWTNNALRGQYPNQSRELQEELYLVAKMGKLSIECSGKKVIGKPCEGEPHARFDEGELVVKSLKYSIAWNQ